MTIKHDSISPYDHDSILSWNQYAFTKTILLSEFDSRLNFICDHQQEWNQDVTFNYDFPSRLTLGCALYSWFNISIQTKIKPLFMNHDHKIAPLFVSWIQIKIKMIHFIHESTFINKSRWLTLFVNQQLN